MVVVIAADGQIAFTGINKTSTGEGTNRYAWLSNSTAYIEISLVIDLDLSRASGGSGGEINTLRLAAVTAHTVNQARFSPCGEIVNFVRPACPRGRAAVQDIIYLSPALVVRPLKP